MEMIPDPHGRMTYPDEIKVKMFNSMYKAFKPWHNKVFFYLCMEKADIWDRVFGWHYERNEDFEREFEVLRGRV
jgi:spore photoproduct lyase